MKSFTDISLDLETYGTEPGCVILEIAMVAFDRHNRTRTPFTFHIFPNLDEQVEMGFKINHQTVRWWIDNCPDQWRRQMDAERYPVDQCAHGVTRFVETHTQPESVLVWAKGAHFDLPILRTLVKDPWHFRNIHDLRTLSLAFPHEGLDRDVTKYPTHQGLEDALFQAMEVQELCSMIVTGG
jgi:hypothetical protein